MNKELAYTDKDFDFIQRFVKSKSGITLSEKKQNMVYSRLCKRVMDLGLKTFAEYCQLLQSEEHEIEKAINLLTTNLTNFFRENHHFEFLESNILPHVLASKKHSDRDLRIWCSASSTGEEVYSILITCLEYLKKNASGFRLKLIASDIDTNALEKAQNGIYTINGVQQIPKNLLSEYFMRGKNENANLVRIKDKYRSLPEFKRLNLNDNTYSIPNNQDIIFCRNVMIYFSVDDNNKIVKKFYNLLNSPGYLIIGHSEKIEDSLLPFKYLGKTIYEKTPRK